jgi:outer membrane protein assembly factor BamD (BamD/ComL family)
LIRDAGGNPLARDKNGKTPFSVVMNDDFDIIKCVLGNNYTITDSDGNTPIHLVVKQNASVELLEFLIKDGYPIDTRNANGYTALNYAIENDNIKLSTMLLENGANPFKMIDKKGRNGVSIALEKNNKLMISNIVKYAGELADIQGNPYMEEACMRVAELSFDKNEYQTARYYFQRMSQVASSSAMRLTALLGVLRCSQKIGDNTLVIEAANHLLDQGELENDVRMEALYYRAKAQLSDNQYGLAIVDFTPVAKEVRTMWGAEAKYQLAYCYFQLGSIDLAEQEIMAFTQMQTSHQYWLAKSLILLSDINIKRNELFQAKQYLLALQSNYKLQDDIPTIINEKLQYITQLEQQIPEPTTETEEDTL